MTLARPPPEEEFSSVSGGVGHTCGLRVDGSLACWGSNEDGYGNLLGQATPPEGEFASVSTGGWHTCGLRVDGSVACWGTASFGQAAPPEGEFASVSAGYEHTCGLRVDGSVACWGQLALARRAAGGEVRLRQRWRLAHLRGEGGRLRGLLGP